MSFNPKLAQKQIFEINKEVEKAKLLKASQAKKSEYGDCAKYVTFSSTDKDGNDTDGKVKVALNQKLIDKSIELAGYNMLITSEISMSQEAVYNAYHNLWRIEESFRIMKSQLDARPVYLQKKRNNYRAFSDMLYRCFADKNFPVQNYEKFLLFRVSI